MQRIDFDRFKEIVRSYVPSTESLSEDTHINCAFVMMSRGVPF